MSSLIHSKTLLAFLVLCVNTPVYAAKISDPFQPPGTVRQQTSAVVHNPAPSWKLQEILLSGDRKIAIINDTAVKTGTVINGALLSEIHPTHIELMKNRKTFRRYISGINIKKLSQ